MDRLYTLKEAKMLLGVCTKTIQRWDSEGKIRVVRTPGVGGVFMKSETSADTGGGGKREESHWIHSGLVTVAER